MNINLDNKVAIVTGAAMGIGLRCAQVLAESGAKVAVVDLQPDDVIAKAISSLKGSGHKGYHANAARHGRAYQEGNGGDRHFG